MQSNKKRWNKKLFIRTVHLVGHLQIPRLSFTSEAVLRSRLLQECYTNYSIKVFNATCEIASSRVDDHSFLHRQKIAVCSEIHTKHIYSYVDVCRFCAVRCLNIISFSLLFLITRLMFFFNFCVCFLIWFVYFLFCVFCVFVYCFSFCIQLSPSYFCTSLPTTATGWKPNCNT